MLKYSRHFADFLSVFILIRLWVRHPKEHVLQRLFVMTNAASTFVCLIQANEYGDIYQEN